MKKFIVITLLLATSFVSLPATAEENTDSGTTGQAQNGSAMQDLQNANQDGKEAVAAPTDEKAKEESNETFDTPHNANGN